MSTDPKTAASIRAKMLAEVPDNGSPLRRLRRWNIEHEFFLTWLFWALVAGLVGWFFVNWLVP